jgi:hypothetical protein
VHYHLLDTSLAAGTMDGSQFRKIGTRAHHMKQLHVLQLGVEWLGTAALSVFGEDGEGRVGTVLRGLVGSIVV